MPTQIVIVGPLCRGGALSLREKRRVGGLRTRENNRPFHEISPDFPGGQEKAVAQPVSSHTRA